MFATFLSPIQTAINNPLIWNASFPYSVVKFLTKLTRISFKFQMASGQRDQQRFIVRIAFGVSVRPYQDEIALIFLFLPFTPVAVGLTVLGNMALRFTAVHL